MFTYNKVFAKAKEENLEALELTVSEDRNFSFSLFRGELDSYNISESKTIEAKGIYNGKVGFATSEKTDDSTVDYLVNHIKQNATLTNSGDTGVIFKGSDKYHKKNVYNKKLAETSPEEKIRLMKELDSAVKKESDLIKEVELQYRESTSSMTLMNSYGLKLTSKSNRAVVIVSAVAVDESGDMKNTFKFKIVGDLDELDIADIAKKVVDETLKQFGSGPCDSGKYRCVFSPGAFSSLLGAFLQNLSSDLVQKNASMLAGKLGEKVASNKLTVYEKPLEKNVFFRYFDDEGVATYNKTLIKNGVAETYLYNLKTAAKENKASTGNGFKNRGGQLGVGLVNVFVKPGSLTEDGLFEKAKNGVYINSLEGLHSGMNPQSGNFSLLAEGFMIRDGKLAEPLSLITVAGNLFDIMNQIQAVGNNIEVTMSTHHVPSVLVKSISVSGK